MVRYTQALPDFDRLKAEAGRLDVAGKGRQILESSWASMPLSVVTFLECAERGGGADAVNSATTDSAATPFGALRVPVIAIMGDLDDDLGPDTAAGLTNLKRQLPCMSAVLVAGADHQYHGHEGELVSAVVNFLATVL